MNGRRAGLTVRAYLGTCTICRHGAYQGDDVTRGRGQWLGMVHTGCLKNATKEN